MNRAAHAERGALTAKNAELLERLGEMTLDTDKIRAQLDQIESGFSPSGDRDRGAERPVRRSLRRKTTG